MGTAEISAVAEPVGGGMMCYSGPGSWSNQACGLGMDGAVSGDELDHLISFYESRGVEPQIELCPFADESLVLGLEARGFRIREFENVLARELGGGEDLRAILPGRWPGGLEIERVDPDDADAIETFLLASLSGFVPEGEELPEGFIEPARRVVLHPRSTSYLARVGGEPAGGAAMESSPPVASLFGTSVLERFRRRGIQQALIAVRLERAREQVCRVVTIHSRPGIPTERNALRLRFTMAYTKAIVVRPGEGLARSG